MKKLIFAVAVMCALAMDGSAQQQGMLDWAKRFEVIEDPSPRKSRPGDLVSSYGSVVDRSCLKGLSPEAREGLPFSAEDEAAWTALVAPWKSSMPAQLYRPVGCLECRMTGYKGRIGIYEIMPMSLDIKKLVANGAELAKLREQAMREGMKPLRIAGAKKVAAGVTTIAEIIKVAPPMFDAI